MEDTEKTLGLFDESEVLGCGREGTRTAINRVLSFEDRAGVRVVFYWHEPIFRFPLSDTLSLRFVAVHLRLSSFATQEELSRAFQHSVATQRRWENHYQAKGLEGLMRGKSSGRPSGIPRTLDGVLQTWFEQGLSNREMAHRLKVSDPAIHRTLARLGLHRRKQRPATLSFVEDADEGVGPDPQRQNHAESETATTEEGDRAQKASFEADGVRDQAEESCHGAPALDENRTRNPRLCSLRVTP